MNSSIDKMFSIVVGGQANQDVTEGEGKFYHLCKDILLKHSLKMYDLDYFRGNSIVRVYILNPMTGTATIDDCVLVNRSLGAVLEKDWLPPTTILEISSPGIERRLSRRCHFIEAVGKDISVVLRDAVSWAKKGDKIIAKIIDVEESNIQLRYKEQTLSLTWEMIKKANLKEEMRV